MCGLQPPWNSCGCSYWRWRFCHTYIKLSNENVGRTAWWAKALKGYCIAKPAVDLIVKMRLPKIYAWQNPMPAKHKSVNMSLSKSSARPTQFYERYMHLYILVNFGCKLRRDLLIKIQFWGAADNP